MLIEQAINARCVDCGDAVPVSVSVLFPHQNIEINFPNAEQHRLTSHPGKDNIEIDIAGSMAVVGGALKFDAEAEALMLSPSSSTC
jgi:hypothetical protein